MRSGGIVLRGEELLVMFRRENGREYYTFPGGQIEEGETPEAAVLREIREETTIEVSDPQLVYELHRTGALPREFFYRCSYRSGTPMLREDSIERAILDPEKNYFEPMWIPISGLASNPLGIPLLPHEVTVRLFHDMQHGFQEKPVVLDGVPIV